MQLTLTPLTGLPVIEPGDDLAGLIMAGLRDSDLDLVDGDILVLAQKIVSKAEGRLVNLATVQASVRSQAISKEVEKDPRLVELILEESSRTSSLSKACV